MERSGFDAPPMVSGPASQPIFFVRRTTEAGAVVFDVIDRRCYFPEHVCTTTSADYAQRIVAALADREQSAAVVPHGREALE
jgi:hypothetical protein